MFDIFAVLPWLKSHLLSGLIFFPALGCVAMLCPVFGHCTNPCGRRARRFSFLLSLVPLVIGALLFWQFDPQIGGLQFEERTTWIASFGISYHLGVDGISLFLVLLTAVLIPLVIVNSAAIGASTRGYMACLFFLQMAVFGTLLAQDLLLFYVFWELMLVPLFLMIGLWGGKRRIYATVKFVLYTLAGSLLMQAALFYAVWSYYAQSGEVSFALSDLMHLKLTFREESWLFLAFALAFGIKVPIVPLHTWLPDAHVEAPTGGSVILAGVLLKMGIYGFFRFGFPLFPRAALEYAPYLAALGVVGVVYGALMAWAQTDIKRLVAYSSVSHLGYCVLGLSALSVMAAGGVIFLMVSHGLATGALFLIVGVLYERRHTREISEYGGLAAKMPVFAFCFAVATLASIALPLSSGFIGEFLTLAGSFERFPVLTITALLGVALGAVYMLTLYKRVMFGELDQEKNGKLEDLHLRETAALVPLVVLIFWLGLFPQPLLERTEVSLRQYCSQIMARAAYLSGFRSSGHGEAL
ncbi:MAG: NADH-quinone oxidoreductase subunit M [Deltaproteobacteria bacterium]|nr:NADH-quinone oxidoreductase subunit M [Deltaproteobacteria bacterium]